MKKLIFLGALSLLILTNLPLLAVKKINTLSKFECQNIMFKNFHARLTPSGSGAVYGIIKNKNPYSVFLTLAKNNLYGETQLHNTIMKNNKMKMIRVKRIEIPANSHVQLKRGGLHLMLFNILEANKKLLKVNLTFSNGCKIKTTAHIKPITDYKPNHHMH